MTTPNGCAKNSLTSFVLLQGDLVGGTGSITGSVIGCGLPNGLPVGISPRGLPNGLPRTGTSPLSSHRSPQKSSPHTSDPSPRNERPSPRTLSWDVDQPLNAAALVPGDGNLAHSHGACYDRRQALLLWAQLDCSCLTVVGPVDVCNIIHECCTQPADACANKAARNSVAGA